MDHRQEELKNPPKNVASHLWEKFKALEKRTNEVTQRSTEKRIKHLQREVLETVTKEFTSDEDKDILREHDVKFGPPIDEPQGVNRKRKRKITETTDKGSSGCADQTVGSQSPLGPVEKLKNFMGVNDHLATTDHSRPPPPTALEQKLNAAIEKGDFEVAEALSDRLSEREAGEKIVAAIDSKKFLERKEIEKESLKEKKKKKLNWGFEPKQRWETKGNM